MVLDDFFSLLSDTGQEILSEVCALAPREEEYLRHYQVLSRRWRPGLAHAALETAILRSEAQRSGKFPKADAMYFTRPALEQATGQVVAGYRARRMQGFERILDLGCSIGGDTLALAHQSSVIGVDLDTLRLHMARANAEALGIGERICFVQADLNNDLPIKTTPSGSEWAVFFDPARRSLAGRRVFSIRDYQPPLTIIQNWLPHFPALAVKISPGVQLAEITPFSMAELEFISLKGELKEAVLWFGPLRTCARRATLLAEGCSLAVADVNHIPAGLPLSEPLDYLYEPDAAVMRAELVTCLGEELDACQLDPDIAYLTSRKKTLTPLAKGWHVLDWFPFQLKKLRSYLHSQNIGEVVVKKRASPIEPQALIHSLRLNGENKCILFLTHLRGKAIVIIAEEG